MGDVFKLNLNKGIYRLSSIKQAINDFKDICDIDSKENKCHFNIEIKLKNGSSDANIAAEFANYVLALMKNDSLV